MKCENKGMKTFATLTPALQETIMYRSCVREIDENAIICEATLPT